MNARVRASTVALIGLALSRAAGAEPAPAVAPPAAAPAAQQAEAALAEAHRLGKQGDADAACVLFEKSARLAPSADAWLNVGICREYRSDLLGALDAFERALAAAQGRPNQQAAIRPRAEALLPRIPSIVIAPPASPGTVVEVDSRPVQQFGQPLRLNPGEHHLEATAAGARPHTEMFFLMPGQTLALNLPELAPALPPQAPSPSLQAARNAPTVAKSSAGVERSSSLRKPLIYGGVGLFAVGGIFSAWQFLSMSDARSRKHDLSDLHGCNIDGGGVPGPTCDAGVQKRIDEHYDDEENARKIGLIGLAATGVGAAAALIGYFAVPEASGAPGGTAVRVELGPGQCAAQLSSRW